MPTSLHDAAFLLAAIASGQTLRVTTYTRITEITPKTLTRWNSAGHTLLKNGSTGSLLMASGRKFVDISHCGLTLT
jgi:hypothetical protein